MFRVLPAMWTAKGRAMKEIGGIGTSMGTAMIHILLKDIYLVIEVKLILLTDKIPSIF